MKIAFIGCGQGGSPLADHLQRLGHVVTPAARDPNSDSVKKAMGGNAMFAATTPRQRGPSGI